MGLISICLALSLSTTIVFSSLNNFIPCDIISPWLFTVGPILSKICGVSSSTLSVSTLVVVTQRSEVFITFSSTVEHASFIIEL
uniref:Putative secreted protein n=1 Tax=Panstrongylus lignarius TaxID=156445 RepID=A0A224XSE9_9HEMI